VGVAAVAHVSGGAAAPSPGVLLASALLLTAAARGAPRRLQSVQARILMAAGLQPALHLAFGLTSDRRPVGVAAMLVAHAAAAAVGAWWLIRGVGGVLSVPERVLAALGQHGSRRLIHPPTSRTLGRGPVGFVRRESWVRSTPRRGPPAPLLP
jgi:hypothetical protein